MNRALTSAAITAVFAVAGCASPQATGEHSKVLPLGDHYESSLGSLFVIAVQNEYRLIRCIPAGPIAGCYEDLFVLPRDEVKFNRWLTVEKVPGLEMAVVSPTSVAFRVQEVSGAAK